MPSLKACGYAICVLGMISLLCMLTVCSGGGGGGGGGTSGPSPNSCPGGDDCYEPNNTPGEAYGPFASQTLLPPVVTA